jgi:magnesium transporter
LLLLGRREFLLWLFGTLILALVVLVAVWLMERIKIRGRYLPTKRRLMIQGLSYGAVSGILSAHTLLIAKSAVELLVRTIVDKVNQFNRWQSFVILLALLAFALSQLYYLHRGLKLTSTSILYPFVFCIYNVVAIIDGLIYFRQASRLVAWHGGLIAVGTIVLLGGVLSLSWRLEDHPPQTREHEHETAEEELPTNPAKMGFPPPKPVIGPGLGFTDPDPTNPDRPENQDTDLEAGEQSPLLARRGSAHGGRPSITRARRMTLASTPHQFGQIEIWDELNDRGDFASRNYGTQPPRSAGTLGSISQSKHSKRRSYMEPGSPHTKRSPRMPRRSATMPVNAIPPPVSARGGNRHSWVGHWIPRNPVDWLTGGGRNHERADDDETAPTEVHEDEPLMGRGHRRSVSDVSRRRRKSPSGGWFRLGWWRRGDG